MLPRVGVWSLFENCTVDASICGQVFKGARWMPWHQEPIEWGNPAVVMGCHPHLNT